MIPNYVDLTESVNRSLKNLLIAGNYTHIAILCDENTLKNCYPLIRNELPEHHIIEIGSGELNKNISTCETVWSTLTLDGFDRNSLLINLGGGVIGDMGGFCACTFFRTGPALLGFFGRRLLRRFLLLLLCRLFLHGFFLFLCCHDLQYLSHVAFLFQPLFAIRRSFLCQQHVHHAVSGITGLNR